MHKTGGYVICSGARIDELKAVSKDFKVERILLGLDLWHAIILERPSQKIR